ncbi:hypothetical protein Tco_1174796 [Tanacetum coccineum]
MLARASLRGGGKCFMYVHDALDFYLNNWVTVATAAYQSAFFFFASNESWVRRDLFIELGFSFGDVELPVSVLWVAMLVTIVSTTLSIMSCDGVPASKLHQ